MATFVMLSTESLTIFKVFNEMCDRIYRHCNITVVCKSGLVFSKTVAEMSI